MYTYTYGYRIVLEYDATTQTDRQTDRYHVVWYHAFQGCERFKLRFNAQTQNLSIEIVTEQWVSSRNCKKRF